MEEESLSWSMRLEKGSQRPRDHVNQKVEPQPWNRVSTGLARVSLLKLPTLWPAGSLSSWSKQIKCWSRPSHGSCLFVPAPCHAKECIKLVTCRSQGPARSLSPSPYLIQCNQSPYSLCFRWFCALFSTEWTLERNSSEYWHIYVLNTHFTYNFKPTEQKYLKCSFSLFYSIEKQYSQSS